MKIGRRNYHTFKRENLKWSEEKISILKSQSPNRESEVSRKLYGKIKRRTNPNNQFFKSFKFTWERDKDEREEIDRDEREGLTHGTSLTATTFTAPHSRQQLSQHLTHGNKRERHRWKIEERESLQRERQRGRRNDMKEEGTGFWSIK